MSQTRGINILSKFWQLCFFSIDRYKKIIRSTDGEGYQSHYFLPDNMEKFYVICLSKIQDHTKLKEEFSDKFFMVNIEDWRHLEFPKQLTGIKIII